MSVKRVTVLGATGSIGESTLSVISQHPERFKVYALTAHRNLDRLFELCRLYTPEYAVLAEQVDVSDFSARLDTAGIRTQVLCGMESLEAVASSQDVDVVVAAIVGAAGLAPTLAAVHAGKRVLLANKEALVMTGRLFMDAVHASGAELLPIDSEHNAIYQCLPMSAQRLANGTKLSECGVRRVLLTASGGPFRDFSASQLAEVTPAQACKHPNWSMGQKISVDSATLMNKGLELIEACWLFDISPEFVDVHIHPESIIHSMVEYSDGSIISQMGNPDMRTPIAYGLSWPDRIDSGVASLDLFKVSRLNFSPPDRDRFPCLALAESAFASGGTAPAILNAANEVAVAAFLRQEIGFMQIPEVIQHCLSIVEINAAQSLDEVLAADKMARKQAFSWIENCR
ncbi:1-deoxy-D-xylulose-5-phosphate reductoisomerase [Hahella sp. CCB-MM4]|uniref:1-deoxy-D-xylulose-5-phosphate reductoisomerase n=1 Tax=Hahella sp. (strain CCB-MM4) TaxID=1926491 RepID=UPI000B9A8F08|nr:1-deoxy-D-xylulose-5-phosphate reductoisomerase [Hahella sp. CCB-MM4]OZG70479.1 1-deoxy-D-xylulose-5-phosphate reductoisomerase [Hahella sp. CCB-MM4]